MNYLPRRRRRAREISFEKVEEIQEMMGYNDIEMAELLGLYIQLDKQGRKKGSSQFYNYRKTYSLPADRYWGARDALLLSTEDRAREEREKIMHLFKS